MLEDPDHLLRPEARYLFGQDPAGYADGRPEYPARVYEVLRTRCSLGPGTAVVEVGPGTGLVTRHLVDADARVLAVEPDPQLRAYLTQSDLGEKVDLVGASFEEAPLPEVAFDLVVAATSFHWVHQATGFEKIGRTLRPGGWAALWWTVFGDPDRPDPFADAVRTALGEDVASQRSHGSFQLDVTARTADLARLGGLCETSGELIRWSASMDVDHLRALYGSLIRVRRRPGDQRDALLATLTTIAQEQFGGVVDRPFVTALYTGQRPHASS